MSYEVYITVEHHPRHCDDWAEKESTAFKFADGPTPKDLVVQALRMFADELEGKWESEEAEGERQRQRDEARVRWEERNRL